MVDKQYPPISVVMPVRNEEAYIERSLTAMLEQDYPGELEVLVMDGQSTDRTREIVAGIAARDPRVTLLANEERIPPAAMNQALREVRYAVIARMDGHSVAPPHYLRLCYDLLDSRKADCAGGRWNYAGETYIARAIGAAMESRFGTGTADWRGAVEVRAADTVPYGMWRLETLVKLGGFDVPSYPNEDYELAYRLRAAGGTIFYSPDIYVTYYSRKNLGDVWWQYFRYGIGKTMVLRKHPRSFRLRQGMAPLLVAGLVGGGIAAWFGPIWQWLYVSTVSLYLMLVILFSIRQAARRGWRYLPMLPLIFMILHVAWGVGFWVGVGKWMAGGREA